MKKIFIFFLALCVGLLAWVGSDPTIEIISPDGTNDNDVLKSYIQVKVKQYNSSNGIDYAKYYLVEDTDNDSIIDQTEWDNRKVIANDTIGIQDINQDKVFTIDFIGKNWVSSDKYYFIIGVEVDLNGDTSCDTSLIVGETSDGGGSSGITDKAISHFKVEGYRP